MRSYVKLPENFSPGFIHYHLWSHATIDLDEDTAEIWGSSKQYKFHINLNDDSYIKNRDKISEFIMMIGRDSGIIGFKYHIATEKTLSENQTYQDNVTLLSMLELYHSNNLASANQMIPKLKGEMSKTAWRLISAEPPLEESAYQKDKTTLQANINSVKRFIGQAQFTLYLLEPPDATKLAHFCALLQAELTKYVAIEGTAANTDLPLIGSSKLITFRQQAFNEAPTVYVGGIDSDTNVQQANAARLKKEALESPLYKTMVSQLQALIKLNDEKHANTPNVGAAAAALSSQNTSSASISNAGNVTTFKTAAATSDKTTPDAPPTATPKTPPI